MKLTKNKIEWVHKKVAHYCSLLKCPVPNVFLTMADYNRWKEQKRITCNYTRVGRSNALGVCHRTDGFIVILPKKAPNCACLDRTIRHELIHWAKPSYNHRSLEFHDRMMRLKNGKIDSNGRFN